MSIIWLYMCSLTNLLSKKPYTTPLDSLTFVIGWCSGQIKLFEKMLTGSPFLSSCCFILFVNSLLAHFFCSSTLPKSLAQAEAFSDDYSKKLQLGTEWGGEKELSVRTWGSARTPPAFHLSPLIPSSQTFFDCKILSIAVYFPPIIFLPFSPYYIPANSHALGMSLTPAGQFLTPD